MIILSCFLPLIKIFRWFVSCQASMLEFEESRVVWNTYCCKGWFYEFV